MDEHIVILAEKIAEVEFVMVRIEKAIEMKNGDPAEQEVLGDDLNFYRLSEKDIGQVKIFPSGLAKALQNLGYVKVLKSLGKRKVIRDFDSFLKELQSKRDKNDKKSDN